MDPQICLEDDLLLEYYKFKNGKNCGNILSYLLNYYKPHLANAEQLKKIVDNGMQLTEADMEWFKTGNPKLKDNLEQLVNETCLKLILSQDKSDYPYVNILKANNKREPIESNYTATFKNEPREKAVKHIKALCSNAKCISIYDKYLKDVDKDNILDLFPKSAFTLYYHKDMHDSEEMEWNKNRGKYWGQFKKYWEQKRGASIEIKQDGNTKKCHDRFLIIDRKIEIILTSGFDNLFSEDGDFTYIVRYF